MNLSQCPKCSAALDDINKPVLMRTYQSPIKEPYYSLGALNDDGSFRDFTPPDMRFLTHEDNTPDVCLSCLDVGEKWLRLPLYDTERDSPLPSFWFVRVNCSELADLINAQNEVKASRFFASLLENDSEFLLADFDEDALDIEEVREQHEEFLDSFGVVQIDRYTRISKNNVLSFMITVHCAETTLEGESSIFEIKSVLKLLDADFVHLD